MFGQKAISSTKDLFSVFFMNSGMNGGENANHFRPEDHKEVTNRWQYYAVSLEFWRKYSDQDPGVNNSSL